MTPPAVRIGSTLGRPAPGLRCGRPPAPGAPRPRPSEPIQPLSDARLQALAARRVVAPLGEPVRQVLLRDIRAVVVVRGAVADAEAGRAHPAGRRVAPRER